MAHGWMWAGLKKIPSTPSRSSKRCLTEALQERLRELFRIYLYSLSNRFGCRNSCKLQLLPADACTPTFACRVPAESNDSSKLRALWPSSIARRTCTCGPSRSSLAGPAAPQRNHGQQGVVKEKRLHAWPRVHGQPCQCLKCLPASPPALYIVKPAPCSGGFLPLLLVIVLAPPLPGSPVLVGSVGAVAPLQPTAPASSPPP